MPSLVVFFLVSFMGGGQVVFGDFDFDGRLDFAVHRDESGPYGSSTFDVYLQNASNRFLRSAPLSELTETNMGLFRVDAACKRLLTFEKSGCCIHVAEEHEVIAGVPRVVRRVTEDAMTRRRPRDHDARGLRARPLGQAHATRSSLRLSMDSALRAADSCWWLSRSPSPWPSRSRSPSSSSWPSRSRSP